jgi:protein SCO1/2
MKRRDFLSLGLAPLVLVGSAHATQVGASKALVSASKGLETGKPMSRVARGGFLPNVPLLTQNGEKVRFYDDLVHDKVVLLNWFYVECADGLCPTAVAKMRQVQDLLGESMGRDIFFLSITLEPKKDTPKIPWKEYADNFHIKPGWSFLTGKSADVERNCSALGYVDWDPKVDKDLSSNFLKARYGNDRLNRWGGVSLRSSAANIASTFDWLSQV